MLEHQSDQHLAHTVVTDARSADSVQDALKYMTDTTLTTVEISQHPNHAGQRLLTADCAHNKRTQIAAPIRSVVQLAQPQQERFLIAKLS